jgi:hypothetical protein
MCRTLLLVKYQNVGNNDSVVVVVAKGDMLFLLLHFRCQVFRGMENVVAFLSFFRAE